MPIRQESEKDFDEIYKLVKVAFQTAKVSNGKEQDFVSALRNGGSYIPELALVYENEGKLIGHIMLTKQVINSTIEYKGALLAAPLSVLLEHRGKGIGSSLIKESFRVAKGKGYTSVFLVGDPAYYSRFGFKPTTNWNIKNTNGIPDQYVMALELVDNALQGITGTIDL